ncbi:hypothetical protein ACFCXP_04635 [Streptomyces niveus]|uniref:hypothetical protein n=1 Tax=Streptomyces niveus TaxID=193462 RepID=UPI0035D5B5D7
MADDNNPITPPATGEPTPPTTPPATPPAAPAGDGPADLGDAGKKALAEERKARRDAETRLKELEPLAAKAKKLEEASKTEAEKLTERATAAEERAAKAEAKAMRLEVASKKGLTEAQAKRLVGSTPEELEADADELLSSFGGSADTGGKGKGGKKPVEQLRPGGLPNPPEPSVADQIAAAEKAKDWGKAQSLKAQQLMQLANPNQ